MLSLLVKHLCARKLSSKLKLARRSLRTHKSLTPDLVFTWEKGWVVFELQLKNDPEKWRRWPHMASLLTDERECQGDLIVLTRQAAVAASARELLG